MGEVGGWGGVGRGGTAGEGSGRQSWSLPKFCMIGFLRRFFRSIGAAHLQHFRCTNVWNLEGKTTHLAPSCTWSRPPWCCVKMRRFVEPNPIGIFATHRGGAMSDIFNSKH